MEHTQGKKKGKYQDLIIITIHRFKNGKTQQQNNNKQFGLYSYVYFTN